MRIAVCDDNIQDIERIKRYTIRMIEYAVDYEFFTKPEELVATYMTAEQKPDMYILDIEMPGMDGLAVAKQIRTYDSKALIVFLTSYTKYMMYSKWLHLILFQSLLQRTDCVCFS